MNETPFYLVDIEVLKRNCECVSAAFGNEWPGEIICGYSVKTNNNTDIISYVCNKLGWYAETVSDFEHEQCKTIGVPQNRMIHNGPNKCLDNSIGTGAYINLDNLDEVIFYCKNRNNNDDKVGLRVNFNLEAECPGETTAGDSVSRFGIDCESDDFRKAVEALRTSGIEQFGLHMHYSSKSRSLRVFEALARRVIDLKEKYCLQLTYVDIGGGLWGGQVVQGKPSMPDYAKTICDILKTAIDPSNTTLIIEPGASVLATSTRYVVKVVNVRTIRGVSIVTTDGTVLHVNPFLSKRNHYFQSEQLQKRRKIDKQIICGCTCVEMDRFIEVKDYPEIQVGDLLYFENAGAYTISVNSNFILKSPKVYLVNG